MQWISTGVTPLPLARGYDTPETAAPAGAGRNECRRTGWHNPACPAPRITHLAKLRDSGLVIDRREGVFVYYRICTPIADSSLNSLWQLLRCNTHDPLVQQDLDRIPEVLQIAPAAAPGPIVWPVTWSAIIPREGPGRPPHGDWFTCWNPVMSWTLPPGMACWRNCCTAGEQYHLPGHQRTGRRGRAEAARSFDHVNFEKGDMHSLPADKACYDTVLLMHALTYTQRPATVFHEASRGTQAWRQIIGGYPAENIGMKKPWSPTTMSTWVSPPVNWKLCVSAGLQVESCSISAIEKRTPNFSVLSLSASKA